MAKHFVPKHYDEVEKTGRPLDQANETFDLWYASPDAKSTDDGLYTKDVLQSIQEKFGSEAMPTSRLITKRLTDLVESDPNRVKLLHKDRRNGSCFKINPPHSQGAFYMTDPRENIITFMH